MRSKTRRRWRQCAVRFAARAGHDIFIGPEPDEKKSYARPSESFSAFFLPRPPPLTWRRTVRAERDRGASRARPVCVWICSDLFFRNALRFNGGLHRMSCSPKVLFRTPRNCPVRSSGSPSELAIDFPKIFRRIVRLLTAVSPSYTITGSLINFRLATPV